MGSNVKTYVKTFPKTRLNVGIYVTWDFGGFGPWRFGTMEVWDHGGLGPWGFGTMGVWDHGGLGPWGFGTRSKVPRYINPLESSDIN